MPTITVVEQKDVSIDEIKQRLLSYASALAPERFPHEAGAFVEIAPAFAPGLTILPETPALVVAAPTGSPLGLVAFFDADGKPTTRWVAANQVDGA